MQSSVVWKSPGPQSVLLYKRYCSFYVALGSRLIQQIQGWYTGGTNQEIRPFTQGSVYRPPPGDGTRVEHGWAVIEANTAWGAGIYSCDPAHVLPVLARACIKREELGADAAAWVLEKIEVIEQEQNSRPE